MLTGSAKTAVGVTLAVGCWWKIFPYEWDPIKYRLKHTNKKGLFFFRIHEFVGWFYMGFLIFRFIQIFANGMATVPSRLWIMNLMWALGYLLYNLGNLQFELRMDEVMGLVNAIFERNDIYNYQRGLLMRKRKAKSSMMIKLRNYSKKVKKRQQLESVDDPNDSIKWTTRLIVFTQFMLIVNPPTHSTQLLNVPCAPQYPSSLIFQCESAVDLLGTTWEKMPFVILEDILETDLMFMWTFNWTFVFLGLKWITQDLEECSRIRRGEFDDGDSFDEESGFRKALFVDEAAYVYRRAQTLIRLLNEAFKFYLEWFPSILFTIAGVFFFGAIRYSDLPFHLYIVFPFCGFRCLIEGITLMAVAGETNSKSGKFMNYWSEKLAQAKIKVNSEEENESVVLSRAFHKSISRIKCTAGSLYTFENSIVLVTLSNTTVLMFNMLVTFKAKSIV